DPDNAEARAALAAVEAKVVRQRAPSTVIDQEIENTELRRAATKAEYDQLMTAARAQLADRNYAGANETANQAKLTLDRNQNVLPQAEYNGLRAAAEGLQTDIQTAQIRDAQEQREKAKTTSVRDAR